MTGLLSGVRVADFSWVQAGPFVSECLAQMGAEVIKIESRKQIDLLRQAAVATGVADKEEKDLDKSVEFNAANLNKLSICLDLKNPKGLEIAKRIISIGPLNYWNNVQNGFQPSGNSRVVVGFDVNRKITAFMGIVIVKAVNAGINKAGHILGTRRFHLTPVFLAI